jgi:hypothetical protein
MKQGGDDNDEEDKELFQMHRSVAVCERRATNAVQVFAGPPGMEPPAMLSRMPVSAWIFFIL